MSTEEIDVGHQDGPAWKIVGRFSTFDEAQQRRLELVMEKDLQVKVHWQGAPTNRFFAVKARQDPALALEEALDVKRAMKKKRKAKINKKRRKK